MVMAVHPHLFVAQGTTDSSQFLPLQIMGCMVASVLTFQPSGTISITLTPPVFFYMRRYDRG